MLPDPIDALRSLVAKVAAVELAAEKQHVLDRVPTHPLELAYFRSLFFSSLIRVREVSGGFCLNHDR